MNYFNYLGGWIVGIEFVSMVLSAALLNVWFGMHPLFGATIGFFIPIAILVYLARK
jgi:hypothetical protein